MLLLKIGGCAESGSERVADDSADSGVRPAVRVERGGMVVGLHLEREVPVVVEFHHARVVFEHGHAPVFRAPLLPDGLCCFAYRQLKKVVDKLLLAVFSIIDDAVEYFVLAMLGPCLREALKLGVGGIAALLFVMRRYLAHLEQVQRKQPRAAYFYKLVVGGPDDSHRFDFDILLGFGFDRFFSHDVFLPVD